MGICGYPKSLLIEVGANLYKFRVKFQYARVSVQRNVISGHDIVNDPQLLTGIGEHLRSQYISFKIQTTHDRANLQRKAQPQHPPQTPF